MMNPFTMFVLVGRKFRTNTIDSEMEDSVFRCCWGNEFVGMAEELFERHFLRWRCERSRQCFYFDIHLPPRGMVDTGADVIFIVNVIQPAK